MVLLKWKVKKQHEKLLKFLTRKTLMVVKLMWILPNLEKKEKEVHQEQIELVEVLEEEGLAEVVEVVQEVPPLHEEEEDHLKKEQTETSEVELHDEEEYVLEEEEEEKLQDLPLNKDPTLPQRQLFLLPTFHFLWMMKDLVNSLLLMELQSNLLKL